MTSMGKHIPITFRQVAVCDDSARLRRLSTVLFDALEQRQIDSGSANSLQAESAPKAAPNGDQCDQFKDNTND